MGDDLEVIFLDSADIPKRETEERRSEIAEVKEEVKKTEIGDEDSKVAKGDSNSIQQVADLVPHGDEERYIPRKIAGKSDIEILLTAYKHRKNTLLEGPTGSGKTMAIRWLARRLRVPYMRVNLNGGTTVEDLVGQWIYKDGKFVWSDGVLVRMMRHGGIFVADEINAAPTEILFVLNSILDDERKIVLTQKDGEVVTACDDFWFVATMNPENLYEGTKMLNEALRDRFQVVLEYDYSREVEKKLELTDDLLEIAKMLRERNDEIRTPVSTRSLVQFKENCELFGLRLAREIFIQKFHIDERKIVREILNLKYITKSEEARNE